MVPKKQATSIHPLSSSIQHCQSIRRTFPHPRWPPTLSEGLGPGGGRVSSTANLEGGQWEWQRKREETDFKKNYYIVDKHLNINNI